MIGDVYGELNRRLRDVGLMLRGGIVASETLPELDNGDIAGTLLLVGHAGSTLWPHFSDYLGRSPGPDPLDRWTRCVIEPVAQQFGCQALYPFEKPWWPFQRWVSEIEGLRPSPLGILVHPEFGLWHGYRAALAFRKTLSVPERQNLPHPCDGCRDKPCVSACPADAISTDGFSIEPCRSYLTSEEGSASCMLGGCSARNACPVGAEYRYVGSQLRFHMAAL